MTPIDKQQWWTAPADGPGGQLIMVTGRKDVQPFRFNPKFMIRVEITWRYQGDGDGMPLPSDYELMQQAQDALTSAFQRDPVAVLTGIFTGEGERQWVFYTLSTHIFGRKLNEALAHLPLLPIEIYCENDPRWEAYDEMTQAEISID